MEEELFNIKSRFGEYPSYKVTKSGKVYSYRQGNVLKPLSMILDSSGYPIVKLYDNTNKVRTIAVHRLIADTFIPNPDNQGILEKTLISVLELELIKRDMVTIGNMQVCNNSISRDNQQPSHNLNGYERFRDQMLKLQKQNIIHPRVPNTLMGEDIVRASWKHEELQNKHL